MMKICFLSFTHSQLPADGRILLRRKELVEVQSRFEGGGVGVGGVAVQL